jgi:uncharacterized RDD family membrane protein YckC
VSEPAAPPPFAPLRRRMLAGFVDWVPTVLLVVAGSRLLGGAPGGLIGFGVAVLAFTVFEARDGRSPGKRLCGLRVLQLDGSPCTRLGSIVRNAVFRWIDAFPGIYLLAVVAIAGSKRRQRLGDQYAGTSVFLDRPPSAPTL